MSQAFTLNINICDSYCSVICADQTYKVANYSDIHSDNDFTSCFYFKKQDQISEITI